MGRFFELATTNKIYANDVNSNEIKSEILLIYRGDCDINGSMVIGPVEHGTNIRFRNMDDFKSYINAQNNDFDKEDVFLLGMFIN